MDIKAAISEFFTTDAGGRVLLKKATNRSQVGAEVGHPMKNGYVGVMVPGTRRKVYAHQIVYLLVHGVWPPDTGMVIDHRDRNRANNAPANLRLVTASGNARNNGSDCVSSYGFRTREPRFRVQVATDRGRVIVNGFKSKDQASDFADLARSFLR